LLVQQFIQVDVQGTGEQQETQHALHERGVEVNAGQQLFGVFAPKAESGL